MKQSNWMSENAVGRYFGFTGGENIRDWKIPHLCVTTSGGRVVRRYKRSDVEAFEHQHFIQNKQVG